MVSIIATIVSRYSLEIPPDKAQEYALRPGEGERERRERVMRPTMMLTVTPGKLPIVFKPRAAP